MRNRKERLVQQRETKGANVGIPESELPKEAGKDERRPCPDLRPGDCLTVLPTLADNSIDMVFTDPPYGHNSNDKRDLIPRWEVALGRGLHVPDRDNRPLLNDGKEADRLFQCVLPHLHRVLKPGGVLCCCSGGGGPNPQFARWTLWLEAALQFKQMVVWDKGPMGMGWHYRRSYETVLVAQKKGARCAWYDTSRRIENIVRHIRKIIPRKDQHPTVKPVALVSHFLRLHTLEGDTALDPFMGSGTTRVACMRLKRKFVGIELSPEYFQMAQERIAKESGA